jgi:hypothetical protein
MSSAMIIEDDGKIVAHLETLGPNLRQALEEKLKPLAARIADDAQSRAQAHIRFLGAKPGAYVASIKGGVASRDKRVVGWVRSGHPLAHILEYGAKTLPHQIKATVAKLLHFEGDAGEVFARMVNHPGADIPAYPAINPAFEDAAEEARATIEMAVKKAAKR